MKFKPLIIILALIAVAAAAFLIFRQKSSTPAPEGVGAEIFEKAVNPIDEKLPDANIFNTSETNPLQNIYKNPFE